MEHSDILRNESRRMWAPDAAAVPEGPLGRPARLSSGRPGKDRLRATGTKPSRRAAQILAEAGPTLSVKEVAAVLNVSADLVRTMHRRGELAALGIRVLRLGRRVRISTASLRRAVDAEL
jgi:excisionase family DNA binding protein